MIELIERMHLGHFKCFPTQLGFEVKQIDNLEIINCGLGTSMFNIAFGGMDAPTSEKISGIDKLFNKQPFAWWIPPSDTSAKLTTLLKSQGFQKEANEDAMVCSLSDTSIAAPKTALNITPVTTKEQIQDFIELLEEYDVAARHFYEKLDESLLQENERLFVGYINGQVVTISILYLEKDAAGIFSLITKESMRGKGYGSDMMKYLLAFSKKNGVRYVTLSASSEEGLSIYKRLGFKSLGNFECFEYKS